MFASLFHEYGFHIVPFDETLFISMLQGPNSISSPMEDEQPGPIKQISISESLYYALHTTLTSIDPHHDIVCMAE
jgi:hypothetical protein